MLEAIALQLVKYALSEDVGTGDITSLNTIKSGVNARAAIVAKEAGVVAGLDVVRITFREADAHLKFRPLAKDGDAVRPGMAVAQVIGDAGSVLKAERTALNFLQRLSGVASLTRRFVERVAGTGAVILDTRKTTPGCASSRSTRSRWAGARTIGSRSGTCTWSRTTISAPPAA